MLFSNEKKNLVVNEELAREVIEKVMDSEQSKSPRTGRPVHYTGLTFEPGFNARSKAQQEDDDPFAGMVRAMLHPNFITLVHDVAERGVRSPVEVYRPGRSAQDKSLIVVTGHMRVCAAACAAHLGLRNEEDCDVPVVAPAEYKEELDREWGALMENHARIDQQPCETARQLKRIIKMAVADTGHKAVDIKKQVAVQLGRSLKTINRMVSLTKLPPETQDMVDEGQIPVGVAYKLAAIGKRSEIQAAASNFLKTGEIRAVIVTDEIEVGVPDPQVDSTRAEEPTIIEGDFEEGSFTDTVSPDDPEEEFEEEEDPNIEDFLEESDDDSGLEESDSPIRLSKFERWIEFFEKEGAVVAAEVVRMTQGWTSSSPMDIVEMEMRIRSASTVETL